MYRLHAMGINIRHIGEFIIDREHGSGDYLLVIFKTNVFFATPNYQKMQNAFPKVAAGNSSFLHVPPA